MNANRLLFRGIRTTAHGLPATSGLAYSPDGRDLSEPLAHGGALFCGAVGRISPHDLPARCLSERALDASAVGGRVRRRHAVLRALRRRPCDELRGEGFDAWRHPEILLG